MAAIDGKCNHCSRSVSCVKSNVNKRLIQVVCISDAKSNKTLILKIKFIIQTVLIIGHPLGTEALFGVLGLMGFVYFRSKFSQSC